MRSIRPWSQELQWIALGVLGAIAFLLGFVGVDVYLGDQGEASSWWTDVYGAVQLFVIEQGLIETGPVPWQLDVARLLAPAVTVLAAVKGLTLLLRDDWDLMRARMARGHVIVCGLGRRGLRLTRSLLDRGEQVVAIEANPENGRIGAARRARAGVVVGDATDPEVLRRAGIGRAGRLISVCDDDGTNASIAATARELSRGRRAGPSLACVIHLHDRALCEFMRSEQIAAAETIPFRLDVFNLFEDGARAMLTDNPVAVDGGQNHPDVIVVGLGWLGVALVGEIARAWRDHGMARHGRLPVALVDPNVEDHRRVLLLRHPWIEEACALRSVPVAAGTAAFEAGEALSGAPRNGPGANGMVAYVCLDDVTVALNAALALRRHAGPGARIVVRTDTEEGLGSLLDPRTSAAVSDIVAFPLLDRICDADAVIGFTFTEQLARAMHEDYRERHPHDSADPSMRPWDALDTELRESNRDAARDVGRKLRIAGCEPYPLRGQEPPDFAFTSEEIETLAREEHERWVADRQRNGWSPGPRSDGEKTSPYMVSFDELTPEVQGYDRDAVRSLPRVLGRTGYGIRRAPRRAP